MIPDYDRAARMAYKTLLALHIESLPVDPLQILSFCKNTVVHSYEELMNRMGETNYSDFKYYYMENKDALTIRKQFDNGQIGYEIYYDNRGYYCRRRFTLGHELGHVILRHSSEEWWEEKEADYFASQLLAPHPIIQILPSLDKNSVAHLFSLSKAATEMALRKPIHNPDQEIYTQIKKQFAYVI